MIRSRLLPILALAFLAALAACSDSGGSPSGPKTFTLTVTKDGTGAGTVTGTGITCGADCAEAVTEGTVVTLTAAADTGSALASWTGCDTADGATCTVTVSADKAVRATFALLSPAFTVHYHRTLSDYDGWTLLPSGGTAATNVTSSASDGWGAVYTFDLSAGATSLTFKLSNGGVDDPAGTLTVDVSTTRVAYVVQSYQKAIPRQLPAVPSGPAQAVLYYLRGDGDYTGWGLHVWGDQVEDTSWGAPLQKKGVDADVGAGFLIDIKPKADPGTCVAGTICFIVHKGDAKDPGPDIKDWVPSTFGNVVFVVTGSPVVSSTPRKVGGIEILGASAHLVAPDLVLWSYTDPTATAFELRYSSSAAIAVSGDDITSGDDVIPLTPRAAAVPDAVKARVPYLTSAKNPDNSLMYKAYDIAPADAAKVKAALKGQLVAIAKNAAGKALRGSQVQTAWALDDLYAFAGDLGVTWAGSTPTVSLWAPTAQDVKLQVFDSDAAHTQLGTDLDMTEGVDGVWRYAGAPGWYGKYYRFVMSVYHWETGRVETLTATDPYSVSLAADSKYSQFFDLDDPTSKPDGWAALAKPALPAPEDIVVYETHIRDFSANDLTVSPANRGKYTGFVTPSGQTTSDGLLYLSELSQAGGAGLGSGLTHVHLLPAFDIATVLEDPAARVDLDSPFADLCAKNTTVPAAMCTTFAGQTVRQAIESFAGTSDQQQLIATYMSKLDGFNWGYDPLHYGVPEGSYASTAEGPARILEFREMVQGLAAIGLRTVMDVVYNHTNASGTSPRSVLDRIVPGYYHRRNEETGFTETSTCCANTASEHFMMRKLMKDTLVRWARDYKVDGFRFDLMGHHMKADVLEVRDALQALTVPGDGVDGSKIYLYGEGWDFGEVAANRLGVNASQLNMKDTGVGTFNDRLRDAVRGGSPFDNASGAKPPIRLNQGFANGGFYDPNELATTTATDKAAILESYDWLKAGLAGNITTFRMVNSRDATLGAGSIGYKGAQTAYTSDPQENIVYVSAHDNQTLFDIMQYKLPTATTMADRVRAQNIAVDTAMLAQGIPFFHMADERLRSKSMERDSYDSGDWFNKVDWTGATNGWKTGLPNAGKDSANWPLILTLFGNANIAPTAADITKAYTHFEVMLRVRKSSPLFRLQTGADVKKRVDFLTFGSDPKDKSGLSAVGLVVMTITDGACAGTDLDPNLDAVVVLFNADKVQHDFLIPAATGFTLHPDQALSTDPVVQAATFTEATHTFVVPPRTTAVFVQAQSGGQGAGLACNTR